VSLRHAVEGEVIDTPEKFTMHGTEAGKGIPCPGCGLVLPSSEGPTHAYLGSSASCWALFGELSAREFGDPAYFGVHQLSVDTYAVQHPGVPERRSIQSVGLHLMTLSLFLEGGAEASKGPALHQRIMANRPAFPWLEPPAMSGRMTVADVLEARDAPEHHRLVREWAQDVWQAWAPHHPVVRDWVEQSLAHPWKQTTRGLPRRRRS
jgi:Family of unknown function (DUF5946)